MVKDYLGGARPGVDAILLTPLPEQWRNGIKTAVCYAVADDEVTGSLRGLGT